MAKCISTNATYNHVNMAKGREILQRSGSDRWNWLRLKVRGWVVDNIKHCLFCGFVVLHYVYSPYGSTEFLFSYVYHYYLYMCMDSCIYVYVDVYLLIHFYFMFLIIFYYYYCYFFLFLV